MKKIVCLLTSNLKDHSLMEAERELSVVSPTKSGLPVNVPEIVQRVVKPACFQMFSNGRFSVITAEFYWFLTSAGRR